MSKYSNCKVYRHDLLFRKIDLSFVANHGYITNFSIGCCALMQVICKEQNIFDKGRISIKYILEFLVPDVPDNYNMNEESARLIFLKAVYVLWQKDDLYSSFRDNYMTWIKSLPSELKDHFPETYSSDVPNAIQSLENELNIQCIRQFLTAIGLYSFEIIEEFMTLNFLSMLISVAKRGRVSKKISNNIKNEWYSRTGKNIRIDLKLIFNIWKVMHSFIDDRNIERNITQWKSMIPQRFSRWRYLLDQAQYTGITAINYIVKVMTTFLRCDYQPWIKLFQLFPEEAIKLQFALKVLENNPWYLYKRKLDKNVTKASNFINLGWVCKEMLIRYCDNQHVNYYLGWETCPKNRNVLQGIVDSYDDNVIISDDLFVIVRGADYADSESIAIVLNILRKCNLNKQ